MSELILVIIGMMILLYVCEILLRVAAFMWHGGIQRVINSRRDKRILWYYTMGLKETLTILHGGSWAWWKRL